MSTILLIGLTPLALKRSGIQRGDGLIFTFLTILAIYLLQRGVFMSTFKLSLIFPLEPLTFGEDILRGRLNVAAVSLAKPTTERQSGRLDVISNSIFVSSKPIASQIS